MTKPRPKSRTRLVRHLPHLLDFGRHCAEFGQVSRAPALASRSRGPGCWYEVAQCRNTYDQEQDHDLVMRVVFPCACAPSPVLLRYDQGVGSEGEVRGLLRGRLILTPLRRAVMNNSYRPRALAQRAPSPGPRLRHRLARCAGQGGRRGELGGRHVLGRGQRHRQGRQAPSPGARARSESTRLASQCGARWRPHSARTRPKFMSGEGAGASYTSSGAERHATAKQRTRSTSSKEKRSERQSDPPAPRAVPSSSLSGFDEGAEEAIAKRGRRPVPLSCAPRLTGARPALPVAYSTRRLPKEAESRPSEAPLVARLVSDASAAQPQLRAGQVAWMPYCRWRVTRHRRPMEWRPQAEV